MARPRVSPLVRFWRLVVKSIDPDGCWLFTGKQNRGYGHFYLPDGSQYAHVFAWEQENGPVPDGMELDHKCRVRHCVRPSHLEPVTHQVNVLRGVGVAAINAGKTHCPQGHAYDILTHDERRCRICLRAASRRHAHKHAA